MCIHTQTHTHTHTQILCIYRPTSGWDGRGGAGSAEYVPRRVVGEGEGGWGSGRTGPCRPDRPIQTGSRLRPGQNASGTGEAAGSRRRDQARRGARGRGARGVGLRHRAPLRTLSGRVRDFGCRLNTGGGPSNDPPAGSQYKEASDGASDSGEGNRDGGRRAGGPLRYRAPATGRTRRHTTYARSG